MGDRPGVWSLAIAVMSGGRVGEGGGAAHGVRADGGALVDLVPVPGAEGEVPIARAACDAVLILWAEGRSCARASKGPASAPGEGCVLDAPFEVAEVRVGEEESVCERVAPAPASFASCEAVFDPRLGLVLQGPVPRAGKGEGDEGGIPVDGAGDLPVPRPVPRGVVPCGVPRVVDVWVLDVGPRVVGLG